MKKSIAVLLVLLLCSVTLFSVSAARINRTEDQVSVSAQTLAGDPAAAAGLTVTEQTTMNYHLLWQTVFAADDPAGADTDFSFHLNQLRTVSSSRARIEFRFNLNGGISSSGDILSDERDGVYTGFPLLPAKDLAEKTAPGETKKGSYRLADYYDALPYELDLYFGNDYSVVNYDDLEQRIRSYFRLGVPEDLVVEIELKKDPQGRTVSLDYSSDFEGGDLWALCTDAGDGFYFSFYLSSAFGSSFAEVPGGFGIYYLPFERVDDTDRTVCTVRGDQLSTIYQIDPATAQVLNLQLLPDGETLAFFTLEEGRCWLNTLSLGDNSLRQRIEIEGDFTNGFFYDPRIEDDFMLVCDGNNHFTLLELEEGRCSVALTGDLALPDPTPESENLLLFSFDSALAYDGARLAIATFNDSSRSANFCLLVYDRSGLVYAGFYQHSQSQYAGAADANSWCVPTDNDGLRIDFESA